MNVLALLASVALGAPAPAPAAPAAAPAPTVASTATTSGVLGLKWGQGPGKDLGPLETISREVVTGRSVSIQCATTSKLPTDVGDSLQFAKLCYWNQALFEVELQVSDPQLATWRGVLVRKYGKPEDTEGQHLRWELADTSILLWGNRLRYVHKPDVEAMKVAGAEKARQLEEKLLQAL